MCAADDSFYEGAYQNQVRYLPRGEAIWRSWPLWLLNGGYVWTVRQNVAPTSIIIELGTGGGVAYFGRRYRMIGCDLSRSSLAKAAEIYQACVQVDVSACIPVPTSSADAVVSSCFWEHLCPDQKESLLREIRRVLRPGGKIVFLYDVATCNPLIAKMRRLSPEKYRQLFLEQDGHVGYESLDANIARFIAHGFDVLVSRGIEKTPILSPSVFQKLGEWGGRANVLFRYLAKLGNPPWIYPYTAVQRVVDSVLGGLLPASWARMALVVCHKPTDSSEVGNP